MSWWKQGWWREASKDREAWTTEHGWGGGIPCQVPAIEYKPLCQNSMLESTLRRLLDPCFFSLLSVLVFRS